MINLMKLHGEGLKDRWRYPSFSACAKALRRKYLFKNPYRVVRKFLQKHGAQYPYQYGETSLITFDSLLALAGISSDDHLFELGAGIGRCALFAAHQHGCKVTAIERVPSFVRKGREVAKQFGLDVSFIEGNFLESSLDQATCIYLYGTMLEDEDIYTLCRRVPKGVPIITISYPLSDYDQRFELLASKECSFVWGTTTGYVQCLK